MMLRDLIIEAKPLLLSLRLRRVLVHCKADAGWRHNEVTRYCDGRLNCCGTRQERHQRICGSRLLAVDVHERTAEREEHCAENPEFLCNREPAHSLEQEVSILPRT